jgi:Uma2 family endonuclease
MPTTLTKPITADELLAMGDIGRCELIYGELVMMSPAGFEHGEIALRMGRLLANFVEENDLGLILAAETGYKIEDDLVRAPDVSFVRKDRIPATRTKGFFPGVPDIAVEVVSPDDSKREVTAKTNMWLANGTSVVWVADPDTMTITIHRVGKPVQRLAGTDELRDEPLLPGFVLPLSKLFKRP